MEKPLADPPNPSSLTRRCSRALETPQPFPQPSCLLAKTISEGSRSTQISLFSDKNKAPLPSNIVRCGMTPLNVVSPRVRALGDRKGWTQEYLARKLQLEGWDVSRESLAKLEARLRRVADC